MFNTYIYELVRCEKLSSKNLAKLTHIEAHSCFDLKSGNAIVIQNILYILDLSTNIPMQGALALWKAIDLFLCKMKENLQNFFIIYNWVFFILLILWCHISRCLCGLSILGLLPGKTKLLSGKSFIFDVVVLSAVRFGCI